MFTKQSKFFLSISAATFLAFSPALADDKDARIEALEAQLQALAGELQAMKAERAIEKQALKEEIREDVVEEATARVFQNIEPAVGISEETDQVSVGFNKNNNLEITSADGSRTLQFFGKAQLDYTQFNDDVSDQPNGTNFRRARIGAQGKFTDDWFYRFQFGFAEDQADIEDFHLTYLGFDAADIRIGHQRPVFGFDENTSAKYTFFTERAAPNNVFSQARLIGLNFLGGGDHWSWGAGVFGETAGANNPGDDEGLSLDFGVSANVLGLANPETESVLHLGAAYSHRRPTDDVTLAYAPTADSPLIVNTGAISNVDSIDAIGLELVAAHGPFSFQSEYFTADVNVDDAFGLDADFDGFYAQASWFITGESRAATYNGRSGTFFRVDPKRSFSLTEGGWGAWELAVRYEHVDLNDSGAGLLGGQLDNTTLGVNWHINPYVTLFANYILVDTDENSVVPDDDPEIFNMRLQWEF